MPRAFLLKTKKHSYRSYRQDRSESEERSEDDLVVDDEPTTLDWQSGCVAPEHANSMDVQQEPVDLSMDLSSTMMSKSQSSTEVGEPAMQGEISMEKTKDSTIKFPPGTGSSAIWRPHEGESV